MLQNYNKSLIVTITIYCDKVVIKRRCNGMQKGVAELCVVSFSLKICKKGFYLD